MRIEAPRAEADRGGAARVRFRVAGVPVEIPLVALALPLAGALSVRRTPGTAAAWTLVVVASVLWHELGHALAMRRAGHVGSIALHWWGGTTSWPPGARPTARQRLAVSLAGPAAGVALGVAAYGLGLAHGGEDLGAVVLADLVFANVGWSLLNLVPLLPWDGGNALDALAEAVSGEAQPRWVGAVGVAVGSLGAAWALATGERWVAGLALVGLITSWGRWRPAGRGPAAARLAAEEIAQGRTAAARARISAALRTARSDAERAHLAEALAWSWLRDSNPAAAREALEPLADGPAPSLRAHVAAAEGRPAHVVALLAPGAARGGLHPADAGPLVAALLALGRADELDRLHREASGVGWRAAELLATHGSRALFRAGRFEEALALCARASSGDPRHAYNAACCCARLDRLEEAATWLRRAAAGGYRDARAAEDPDLAPLRGRPELEALAPAASVAPRAAAS